MPLGAAHAATIENSPVLLKRPSPKRTCRCHLALHHCVAQVRCHANGLMYAGFSSHWTHMKSGKYDYTVRFPPSIAPWVFVKRIKAATMRNGCILHLPTLAEIMRLHLKERSSPYQLNKERSRAHGEQSDHSHSSIIHMTSTCSHEHTSKDLHNNGTPRPSFHDLMRPRHPFVFLPRGFVFPSPCIMPHRMSPCTCPYVSSLKKKELRSFAALKLREPTIRKLSPQESQSTVHQLTVQIQELQDKVNLRTILWSFFHDLETASSSGFIPRSKSSFNCSSFFRKALPRFLQPDTRNLNGTSGTVLEDLLAPNEPTAACFGNSRNLADTHWKPVSLNTGRPAAKADESGRNSQNLAIPTSRSARTFSIWNPPSHAEGAYPHNCMVEQQKIRSRRCISINSLILRHFKWEVPEACDVRIE